jgi:hypothetical protein
MLEIHCDLHGLDAQLLQHRESKSAFRADKAEENVLCAD